MAAELETTLPLKTLIPPLCLPSARGGEVDVWDMKGRKHLVLVFLPGGPCAECDEFIEAAQTEYEHYHDDDTALMLIVRDSEASAHSLMERLKVPFPVLYDKSGDIMARYTRCLPAVFVADKFGELEAQWIIGPGGEFPAQKEILDVLDLINLECPE